MPSVSFASDTGELVLWTSAGRQMSATAFAGNGEGLNNPLMERERNVGPLPKGVYRMALQAHPKFRSPAWSLHAMPGTETFGRKGFWLHGGEHSEGCVIASLPVRRAILSIKPDILIVHHARPAQPVDLISDAQVTPGLV